MSIDDDTQENFPFAGGTQEPPPTDADFGTLRVGHVYIMVNSAMPGILKIGMTTRSPQERAAELFTTGVPQKWKVHFSVFVPDCQAVENLVHRDLRLHRGNLSREFFTIGLAEAQTAIERRAYQNMELCPGWPDPASVKSHRDKAELERRQIIETKRLRDEQLKADEVAKHRDWTDKWTRQTFSKSPWSGARLAVLSIFSAFIMGWCFSTKGWIFSAIAAEIFLILVMVDQVAQGNVNLEKNINKTRSETKLPAITMNLTWLQHPVRAPLALPNLFWWILFMLALPCFMGVLAIAWKIVK